VQTQAVGADGPAGFRLPPVVDHRHPDCVFGPVQGVGIEALAGQKKGLEIGQVVFFHQFGIGVLALDGPKAVGAVNMDFDLVLAITRQKTPASGVPTGLPSKRMVVQPLNRGP
jgi:hypothetical protein